MNCPKCGDEMVGKEEWVTKLNGEELVRTVYRCPKGCWKKKGEAK